LPAISQHISLNYRYHKNLDNTPTSFNNLQKPFCNYFYRHV